MYDKHSKISDILNEFQNITGVNQKEELKQVLLNKGLNITDSDSIVDMVNKINDIPVQADSDITIVPTTIDIVKNAGLYNRNIIVKPGYPTNTDIDENNIIKTGSNYLSSSPITQNFLNLDSATMVYYDNNFGYFTDERIKIDSYSGNTTYNDALFYEFNKIRLYKIDLSTFNIISQIYINGFVYFCKDKYVYLDYDDNIIYLKNINDNSLILQFSLPSYNHLKFSKIFFDYKTNNVFLFFELDTTSLTDNDYLVYLPVLYMYNANTKENSTITFPAYPHNLVDNGGNDQHYNFNGILAIKSYLAYDNNIIIDGLVGFNSHDISEYPYMWNVVQYYITIEAGKLSLVYNNNAGGIIYTWKKYIIYNKHSSFLTTTGKIQNISFDKINSKIVYSTVNLESNDAELLFYNACTIDNNIYKISVVKAFPTSTNVTLTLNKSGNQSNDIFDYFSNYGGYPITDLSTILGFYSIFILLINDTVNILVHVYLTSTNDNTYLYKVISNIKYKIID